MEIWINTLPVPDTKNILGIVLEDNYDDIIKSPIAPPIAPEVIIVNNDNNNYNDNNNQNGNIPVAQDNIGNPGVRNIDELYDNKNYSHTPGVKS